MSGEYWAQLYLVFRMLKNVITNTNLPNMFPIYDNYLGYPIR